MSNAAKLGRSVTMGTEPSRLKKRLGSERTHPTNSRMAWSYTSGRTEVDVCCLPSFRVL